MSDDLKERLQKHDWRHLTARIEQLEAQLAEEKARHALTIQQSDHFSAQLAATREALQATRDDLVTYGLDDFDDATKEATDRIDAALATAPATDGEKRPRVNRLVLGDDLDDGQRGKERD